MLTRLLILISILLPAHFSANAAETTPQKEETFVNPLFYQPMEGTSYKVDFKPDLVLITPTSYYIQNYYGYRNSAPCEMLENTMDTVTLKCLHKGEDRNDPKILVLNDFDAQPIYRTYKFVIMDKEKQTHSRGTYVLRYSYYMDEKKPSSRFPFLIYNDKEYYRNLWGDLIDKHFRDLPSQQPNLNSSTSPNL